MKKSLLIAGALLAFDAGQILRFSLGGVDGFASVKGEPNPPKLFGQWLQANKKQKWVK
jgi:hypothetical protein